MNELAVEQRIDRLEKYAQAVCFRCRKMIPFNESGIIITPYEEKLLCYGCASDYKDIVYSKEQETSNAPRAYLEELREVKY